MQMNMREEALRSIEAYPVRHAYAWELERGRKTWRVPVRGGVVTNDGLLGPAMAKLGLGLAYALEPAVQDDL